MALLLSLSLFIVTTTSEAAPKTPTYGWCCKKHSPRVAAQSGHVDSKGNRYCRSCFRQFCPRLYAEIQKRRLDECGYCGETKELQKGFCRPCRRARECKTCRAFNSEPDASVCVSCCERRVALGATAQQLASWCLKCTTLEERESNCCPACYTKVREQKCHNCNAETKFDSVRHKCVGLGCAQVIYICEACKPHRVCVWENVV